MRRKLTALALTAVSAFALSGCIKLDMDMKVTSDAKIDGTMIVAFNEAAMKQLESMGDSLGGDSKTATTKKQKSFEEQTKDDIKDAQKKLPKGSTVKLYKKNGWLGQEISFKGVDPSVAMGAGLGASATGSGGTSSGTDTLKIVKVGNTLKLDGVLDMGGGTGSTGSDDMSGLMGASKPELRVKFTFPGKVTSSNGKISGNSVTWTPVFGKKLVMKAVANSK